MELKKSPKADLERHKFVFRLIGASIAILLAITVIQWKSFSDLKTHPIIEADRPYVEELPPVVYISDDRKPAKPKSEKPADLKTKATPAVKKKLVVVSNTQIVPNAEKNWGVPDYIPKGQDEELTEPVPYVLVESMPVFPGCEGLKGEELKLCFEERLLKFVADNVKYPTMSKVMGVEGRVFVSFVVDKNGEVKDVEVTRGPDKYLIDEGARLVNSLPKMSSPAMQRGKPVPIQYGLPIKFALH